MSLSTAIRPATQDDLRFVFSTWLKSFRSEGHNKIIPRRFYFKGQTKIINSILESKNGRVAILFNPEEPEQLFGWVCYSQVGNEPILHYAYTKTIFRNMGVFKLLVNAIVPRLNHEDTIVTCVTKEALELRLISKYKLVFHPFLEHG